MPKQTCEDCERPIDEEACYGNKGFCVDCCKCPEHHDSKTCDDCGVDIDHTDRLCPDCFDQWLQQASRGGR